MLRKMSIIPEGMRTNDDMPFGFLSLPRELRDQIYELALWHQKSTKFWSPSSDLLTPGLFRVNKAIHYEVTSLFYSHTCFRFTQRAAENVSDFLGLIGRNNADCIRHICVGFPKFNYQEPGNFLDFSVTLKDTSVGILTNIQSGCANLSTLTLHKGGSATRDLENYALEEPWVITGVLKLINPFFRAMSSLQWIIIDLAVNDLYGRTDLNNLILKEMESQGWIKELERDDGSNSTIWVRPVTSSQARSCPRAWVPTVISYRRFYRKKFFEWF
jgi:hypothetical protein